MKKEKQTSENRHDYEILSQEKAEAIALCKARFDNNLKLAEQGDVKAQAEVAYAYTNGSSVVEQDNTKALFWHHKAAENGDAYSAMLLGGCYEEGFGVVQDEIEAVKWYYVAAKGKCVYALESLTRLMNRCYNACNNPNPTTKNTKDDKSKAETSRLVRFFQNYLAPVPMPLGMTKGSPEAQYELGLAYETGNGVDVDLEEAFKWYYAAANRDHIDAQYKLGRCYLYGYGVYPNKPHGIAWLRTAATPGYTDTESDN